MSFRSSGNLEKDANLGATSHGPSTAAMRLSLFVHVVQADLQGYVLYSLSLPF